MLLSTSRPSPSRRTVLSASVALAAALLVSACGSSAPSTSMDPAAACAASEDLKTSVESLDAVDLSTAGVDDLKTQIDAVASATGAVIESAPGDLGQQAEDLEGAVNDLEAAYEEAAAGTISDSVEAIDGAIAIVKTHAAAMETALAPSCP